MATQTQLANRALTRCGALRIMDLSDPGKSGRAVNACYEGVRDSCQAIANWRFCIVRENLQATTAQPGFAYAYTIPADWLRFITIRDKYVGVPLLGPSYKSEPDPDYTIETNRTLLTHYAPPLLCSGVRRVSDASLHDPLFNDFFVLSLAIEMWEDVSRKSATKLGTILEERNRALSIARVSNSIQEAPEQLEDSSWLLSREGP